MSSDDARLTNLLGALALAIGDLEREATEAVAGRGAGAAAALVTLHANPGLAIEELRVALDLTHSGGVRLVDRLVRDGLLERRPATGRRLALHLTRRGTRAARAALRAREQAVETALAALDPSERRLLAPLVEAMLARLTDSRARAWSICRLCDDRVCPLERCPVERAADAAPA